GGFVFDCRALPNPGRYPEYRMLTGKDQAVIEFLQKEAAVDNFLTHIKTIVIQAVDNYLERGFDHLSVNFGCTGGQHRSVYSAEKLFEYLQEKYSMNIILRHRMME
ncbi:MAG: phosphotransferase, partial [Bacteroidales bacterium]|nr:phosphotransferase [Bacteroidales bacterium]